MADDLSQEIMVMALRLAFATMIVLLWLLVGEKEGGVSLFQMIMGLLAGLVIPTGTLAKVTDAIKKML